MRILYLGAFLNSGFLNSSNKCSLLPFAGGGDARGAEVKDIIYGSNWAPP